MFVLDDAELYLLTKKQKAPAQKKALRAMGITYRERLDGSPMVTSDAVNAALGVGLAAQPEAAGVINLEAITRGTKKPTAPHAKAVGA